LASPFDPSSADVAAGLHYSFALSEAGLLNYQDSTTASSASFANLHAGTYTVWGRISDKDGDYTDYSQQLTVQRKALTASITADDKTYDGSTSAVTHITLGSGVVG